jgi:lysophospholipase L1-like esterase
MLILLSLALPGDLPAAGEVRQTVASAAITIPECEPRGGLPNFFAKLEAGGPVRIAYLGGSITEAGGWRVLSREWFAKQYPQARVEEIRATISGTGGEMGALRLPAHVLRHDPDLVFVEFAVNGTGANTARSIRSMEGIVRQVRRHDPRAEVCFVFTFSRGMLKELQANRSPRVVTDMKTVADHYGVPTIDFAPEVARLERAGKLVVMAPAPEKDAPAGGPIVFSTDGTHPLDAGHRLYLDAIVRSVPALKAVGRPGPRALPAPLDPDNWETAALVALDAPGVLRSAGWQKIEPPDGTEKRQRISQYFPGVWAATRPGETLAFSFEGVGFGLSGFRGPMTGLFRVTVDDREPVDATFFDSYSYAGRVSHKAWFYPHDLPRGQHRVHIEFLPGRPGRAAQKEGSAAAAEPSGPVLQFAALLLAGSLVE